MLTNLFWNLFQKLSLGCHLDKLVRDLKSLFCFFLKSFTFIPLLETISQLSNVALSTFEGYTRFSSFLVVIQFFQNHKAVT
ncbi:hypothetical protein NBO_24g0025 [Nosema bombycis CQ1]|uniref:Uncharacterized protein n=1 Tax=Nosema bombycis (strain CQ1 / CVCC 102059) TaxID=578461 RepID=R0MK16_NOSB1|nr:hypothetical protein NBO_24g0025 [Nosema bombycis CQ1]|eukprot:EOB14580.1 hypothetical protein NBO_24g0025 [Nosema bombycis CQ1]